MPTLDNPIINSPFTKPIQHWALDERGMPTGEVRPSPSRKRVFRADTQDEAQCSAG
jgi:hypothetical protein